MLSNLAPDHLKLTFSILATYPYALLFRRCSSTAWKKHMLSIGYTTFIMLGVLQLQSGFIHITAISLTSYLLLYFFREYQAIAWINFVVVLLSMSLCHIGRQWQGIEGDTKLDYSGALMIVTIKLSSFGFNIVDASANEKREPKHVAAASVAIVEFPSLMAYFGWCFYFAGFLVGPTCEYMDYIRFIIQQQQQEKEETTSWKPALKKLSQSLLFLIPLVYLAPTFNYFQALKPDWKTKSFLEKLLFIQISAILTRCKYYFIWFLSEGACILSGFGSTHDDVDGRVKWNKLTNVHVWECEFAQSYKQLSAHWNMGANNWLRHYVYLRIYPFGLTYATLMTYVTSSIWHGFHPGYYLFFMTAGGLQIMARQVRKVVRPLFLTGTSSWKSFYDVSTWVVSMGLLNMFVPCFDLLHVSLILEVWHEVYYCHYLFIVLGTVLFYTLKPTLLKLKKDQ